MLGKCKTCGTDPVQLTRIIQKLVRIAMRLGLNPQGPHLDAGDTKVPGNLEAAFQTELADLGEAADAHPGHLLSFCHQRSMVWPSIAMRTSESCYTSGSVSVRI